MDIILILKIFVSNVTVLVLNVMALVKANVLNVLLDSFYIMDNVNQIVILGTIPILKIIVNYAILHVLNVMDLVKINVLNAQ